MAFQSHPRSPLEVRALGITAIVAGILLFGTDHPAALGAGLLVTLTGLATLHHAAVLASDRD